ncbi:L-threonylcarbamoyladenylate synthase [Desulfurobacterium indicum]|uniref:L-threonylcarbamoyladenylate synthase n=1 Tax=Desulfurobacterium indicum TaxID=1914305 RepID=A0A1R1MN86_9BACT|nr:L-threonylcarbamoyladenylate synthase [Desulfurobacterium indicum]OMH41275.1 threonylcarbamoyl-AMP synthase [Desulfurobacterium indicum]
MKILTFENDFCTIKKLILSGELLCSPTDTQYGLIGNALNRKSIETVYKIKKRDRTKPLIVLFDCIETLKKYGIYIPSRYKSFLEKIWPGRVTVILPLKMESPFKNLFERNDLAVRIPAFKPLRDLITATTPLFAPSANIQGEKPASGCSECERYFEGNIKYCIKGKTIPLPSTLISLTGKSPKIIREGVIPIGTIEKLLGETEKKE